MSGYSRDSFHVLFNMDEFQFSMRGLKILLTAFIVLHLIAAFLAPAAYKAMIWWNASWPNSLNDYLIGKPFPEYFDRARILLMLLSLPWLFIQCRLLSARKLGYSGDFPWYTYFLRFYMVGVIWAVCVLGILLSVGVVAVESSLTFGGLMIGLFVAFLAAFLIGSMEELMFRGLFFRMFYTAFTPAISVFLSSLFFAYVHFKQPKGLWDYDTLPAEVGWLDGLSVGFRVLTGITVNFDLVLFLNLSLLGYVLTVVFMKTKSLWAAVGLHAGLVTPISFFMKIAVRDLDQQSLWWGTFRLADGYFSTACLLFIAVYFSRLYRPRQPSGFSF
ncbi:MAG: CPBP family intramembrane metalloprotease [Verrucomicrobia bacterium]|nr:CPBP family intramembrane metalloprotease [Verrucomicrobiota bacterium]